jgi:hypothetical protein
MNYEKLYVTLSFFRPPCDASMIELEVRIFEDNHEESEELMIFVLADRKQLENRRIRYQDILFETPSSPTGIGLMHRNADFIFDGDIKACIFDGVSAWCRDVEVKMIRRAPDSDGLVYRVDFLEVLISPQEIIDIQL